MRVRIKLTFITLTVLLISACGYHMRGAYDLPAQMKNVFIQGGSPIFRDQFNNVLKSSSGQLVDSPEKADMIVRIKKDEIVRRVLSLSERGRSNDIELAGHVEYELVDTKSGVLVANQPVDFRREYYNDQQDVMAKDNEETVIRKEMYQQLVRTIINQGRMALEAKGK